MVTDTPPRILSALRELIEPGYAKASPGEAPGGYAAVVCDVWGVLHDGVGPYAGASECLLKLRALGMPVILLSNAPRPSPSIIPQLRGFGYRSGGEGHYDAIVTSGDATRAAIVDGFYGVTLMHLGPERDLPLLDGLDLEFAGPEQAAFVLCTGLYDDTRETPDDYHELLAELLARNVPMLCANPDQVVMRGEQSIYCAGALARAYAAIGGAVTYFGKPYPGVYQLCTQQIGRILGRAVAPRQILAIGDGLQTDMAGGQAAGHSCLFISGGIHGPELTASAMGAPVDYQALLRACAALNLTPPDAVMYRLVW